ncbi:MAG TPA: hypothetical protein PLN89_08595, partial [Elusimicrobiota bacterium]|nr:hypothetical protein [Elusimicrobiota bacterium]
MFPFKSQVLFGLHHHRPFQDHPFDDNPARQKGGIDVMELGGAVRRPPFLLRGRLDLDQNDPALFDQTRLDAIAPAVQSRLTDASLRT